MADARQKLLVDIAVKNQAALGGVAAGLANIQRSSFSAGKALKFAAAGIAAIVSVKLMLLISAGRELRAAFQILHFPKSKINHYFSIWIYFEP